MKVETLLKDKEGEEWSNSNMKYLWQFTQLITLEFVWSLFLTALICQWRLRAGSRVYSFGRFLFRSGLA